MLNRIIGFIILIGSVPALQAAEVNNLYQVEVTVADQSQAERNRAIGEGFRRMLVKVTGNSNVDQKSTLKPVFNKASRYVQQYRYRVEEASSEQAGSGQLSEEKRYLQIFFDKLAVDRTLRDSGLPVWGKSRPQVLAWVGFEQRGKRTLLIPDFNPGVSGMLAAMSDERGIPFLLPLMDLEDQSALSAGDLWGSFEQPLRDASERYDPDMILVAKVKAVSDNRWVTQWSLLDGQDVKSWESRGDRLAAVLRLGINEMADVMARSYAPAGGNETQVLNMQISAVGSFADLVRVQSFMDEQETVQGYQVRATDADRLILSLNLRGGVQAFTQAVNLSGFLIPEEGVLELPTVKQVPAVMPGSTVTPAQPAVVTSVE